MEFNTIAISDGITMGTEGMKASLVSRDLIADSIELVARGHMFDGIIALVACDKTIPGAAMALLRLNTPGVIFYGGSICRATQRARPHYSGRVRGGRRQRRGQDVGRRISGHRELRVSGRGRLRRPVHRQYHGDRDGADRSFSAGNRTVPQVDARKHGVAARCGRLSSIW